MTDLLSLADSIKVMRKYYPELPLGCLLAANDVIMAAQLYHAGQTKENTMIDWKKPVQVEPSGTRVCVGPTMSGGGRQRGKTFRQIWWAMDGGVLYAIVDENGYQRWRSYEHENADECRPFVRNVPESPLFVVIAPISSGWIVIPDSANGVNEGHARSIARDTHAAMVVPLGPRL